MIVLGAGGFAKELIEAIPANDINENLSFFDDRIKHEHHAFLGSYSIVHSWDELFERFSVDNRFVLGIGGPKNRERLSKECIVIGGKLTSIISDLSHIGSYDVKIGEGATILHEATIANGSRIGKGALIYYNVQITHDCVVGDFCELSPGATLLGNVQLGDRVHVGANATILPGVIIGNDVIIGAGSVVTKNIADGTIVKGIPAK